MTAESNVGEQEVDDVFTTPEQLMLTSTLT
jgi:hypothetical protein